MTDPTTITKLILRRTFSSPRATIFKAWTDATEIKRWFAPTGMDTPEASVDLRVGGKYRIVMRMVEKDMKHVATGIYREIKPPERLVFTWWWEGDPNPAETLVTVDLVEKGTGTELILTHEYFPTEEAKQQHNEGWIGCLDRLAETFNH